jgi:hypothetical protein
MNKIIKFVLLFSAVAALGFFISSRITVFIISPIGAIPSGRIFIISRQENTNFIDSADAICLRNQGTVDLMCRGITLGVTASRFNIYATLPYSESLYQFSIRGSSN